MAVSASLDGLQPEFRQRLEALLAEAGKRLWVQSAFRSRAEQQKLYDLFIAGKGNPANKPGTSMHERGLAADVDGDYKLLAQLAKKYGFYQPHLSREPWHLELDPARTPLEASHEPSEPQGDDEMPPYFKVECLTGGYWLVKHSSGGVYAYSDAGLASGDGVAPFFGSMAGSPMNAPVVDLVPFVDQDDSVVGYLLIGADGGSFAFGKAGNPDNYVNHPDWHGGSRTVIGAIQNGAGYTLITVEDGSDPPKLDTYDFSRAYPKN